MPRGPKGPRKPQESRVIVARGELCSGCGICQLACSLYHEGECSPSLSRIGVNRDFLTLDFAPYCCIQCDWPACYFECPTGAVRIDESNGVRYIDPDSCTGCGRCARVCPLMPEKEVLRLKKVKEKKVYFKCDLCRGRESGPVCIQMCPRNVLELSRYHVE